MLEMHVVLVFSGYQMFEVFADAYMFNINCKSIFKTRLTFMVINMEFLWN